MLNETSAIPVEWRMPPPVARRRSAPRAWIAAAGLLGYRWQQVPDGHRGCVALGRQGWTRRRYRAFVEATAEYLGYQARDQVYGVLTRTGPAWVPNLGRLGDAEPLLRAQVIGLLDRYVDLPLTEATGWVRAFVVTGYRDSSGLSWWLSEDRLTLPILWAGLGDLGPLAWAAGLTPEEARAERAAGRLNAESVGVLLALRGISFPR